MNDNNNKNNSGGNRNGQSLIIFLVCLMVGLIGMSLFSGALDSSTSREITYDKFIDMLENDEIASVEIGSSRIEITPKTNGNDVGTIKYYTKTIEDGNALTKRLEKYGVEYRQSRHQ